MPATLTDADPMPFGKHKGQPMSEVPAAYLLWLYDNDQGLWNDSRKWVAPLKRYIEKEWESLRQLAKDYQPVHFPEGARKY